MNSLSITSTTLESSPPARVLAMLIWAIIASICVGLFLVDMTSDYADMLVPCDGEYTAVESECNFFALSTPEVEVLSSLGLSTQHYALFTIMEPVLVFIVYLGLGFLVLWRKGTTLQGLTISLALVVIPYTMFTGDINWTEAYPKLATLGTLATLFGNLIMISFLYLLPDGRFYPKWAFVPATCLYIIIISGTLLGNDFAEASDQVAFIGGWVSVSLVLLGGVLQIYRYIKISDPVARQQTRWIIAGVICFILSIVVWIIIFGRAVEIPAGSPRLVANMIGTVLSIVTLLALPAGLTIAILRYNFWDLDLAINRSLVGLIVTALLAIVFIASVFIFQSVLNAENPLIGLLISAIGPAVLFNPARKFVRSFVDRRLYGLAFDLDELNAAQRQREIANPGKLSGNTLGDYTVLDVIGKGGMGEVYKGQGNNQIVAIKTMLPEVAADATMRTRFRREAEIGKSLDHPGIAKIYSNGTYENTPYLVMEYIDGGDIGQQLKTGKTYDVETATTIIEHVCDALDQAHARGYVHRDIKPGNVMLRETGAAVLMDFGVTKVADASVALTGTGAIGTISYMAPEQIKASKDVDHRADIYALGIMLYEMLTGEQPFSGGPAQVMFAHLQQPAPDPRDLDDTIPAEIADAILVSLEKEPDNRFQSAGDFASALNNAMAYAI